MLAASSTCACGASAPAFARSSTSSLPRSTARPSRSHWVARRPIVALAGPGGSGSSGADEPGPPAASSSGPTTEEAYVLLGLKAGASYDEVLGAKNRLLKKHHDNSAQCEAVEAAYDKILMAQMTARLSGSLPVSASVRFADVAPTRRREPRQRQPASRSGSGAGGGGGGGLGVSVRPPPAGATASVSIAIFGGLAAWTLAQGLLEPPGTLAAADVPGLQLALGCATSVYLQRQARRTSLPKALGLTLAGLVAGTLIGGGLESWLRVDLTPLGGLSSPGTVVGLCGLSGLAAAALLLA